MDLASPAASQAAVYANGLTTHICIICDIRGMDKIMETAVKDTHFFNNTELGHHFPVVFFLE